MNPFDLICNVLINALSMLPLSPFKEFLGFEIPFFNLGFVNYFIPFQDFQSILVVYISTLLIYYAIKMCVNSLGKAGGK